MVVSKFATLVDREQTRSTKENEEGVMATYLIQDLAIETGLAYHTIHYYIREGLMEGTYKTIGRSRVRVFEADGLARLKQIMELRNQGHTVPELRERFKGGSEDA